MSQKAFKDAYRSTSKRKATTMEETSCKMAEKRTQFFAGKGVHFTKASPPQHDSMIPIVTLLSPEGVHHYFNSRTVNG